MKKVKTPVVEEGSKALHGSRPSIYILYWI